MGPASLASVALGCVLVMLVRGPMAQDSKLLTRGDSRSQQVGFVQGARRRTLGTDTAASIEPHDQGLATASATQSNVAESAQSASSEEEQGYWSRRDTSPPPPARGGFAAVDPFAPDECWDLVAASSVHTASTDHEEWKDVGYPSDYELFPSDYERDDEQDAAARLANGDVEVERWGRSRRRRSDSSPPPPRAFRGYPRAPPFGAPQAPDWSSLYNWPQAPVVVAPLWPVAPPFTGWPSAPPGGTPAAWQTPDWQEHHKGWPKAPPYGGAPKAPPFNGWPQAPPYGMPAEWQSPDFSRTHVGWPPAPPQHVWNGKCETVIKDQQVVYVQSSAHKTVEASHETAGKKAENMLLDVDNFFDGGDKNGEDASETGGYDFSSSVGPRTHADGSVQSAATPKIEISSSSRRVAMYQVGMAVMSGVVALVCVALVAAARRYVSDKTRRTDDDEDDERGRLLTYRTNKSYGSTSASPYPEMREQA